jgi:hypothetical protein
MTPKCRKIYGCFYEGQTCEELLAKTHNWFKSF